jgi:tRNA (guanine37-N1)-methyltransferase
MRIDVVTLFPELFETPLRLGLLGRALAAGIAEVRFVDPRTFTSDAHRTVDDAPYGGGAGMVMKPEPLRDAIAAVRRAGSGPIVMMTPQGTPLEQRHLARWSRGSHLGLVCGRYEGFDERVRRLVDEEVSLGDFVSTGGEYAALAIVDGVVRLLEGTLGNERSALFDSFSSDLLEHPHYTRPVDFDGDLVPEILRSGDHEKIAAWRHAQALERTLDRRPDLFVRRGASGDERALLAGLERPDHRVSIVVGFERPPSPEVITALARLAAAYRVRRVHLAGPVAEALELAPIASSPAPLTDRERKKRLQAEGAQRAKRAKAHGRSEAQASWQELRAPVVAIDPRSICVPLSGTELPGRKILVGPGSGLPIVGPREVRSLDAHLLFGPTPITADARFPELRLATPANDLPRMAAVGITLDRIFGESA